MAPEAAAKLWRCSKTRRSLKEHNDLNARSLRSSRVLSKNPRGGRPIHRPCRGVGNNTRSPEPRGHRNHAFLQRQPNLHAICSLLWKPFRSKAAARKKSKRVREALIAFDGLRQKILGGSGSIILRAWPDDPEAQRTGDPYAQASLGVGILRPRAWSTLSKVPKSGRALLLGPPHCAGKALAAREILREALAAPKIQPVKKTLRLRARRAPERG